MNHVDTDHCNRCGRYHNNWFDPCLCSSHDPVLARKASDALAAELNAIAAAAFGRDVKQARGEARQSGAKRIAQPHPGTPT